MSLVNAKEMNQSTKFNKELVMYLCFNLCLLDFVFFNPLCNRQSVISRSSAWMPSSHPPPVLSIHVYTDPEDQMKRSFILDPVYALRNDLYIHGKEVT